MDIKLALMSGIDIPISELQLSIHQPTIKEISYIGEEGFFIATQYLCLNKQSFIKDEKILQATTNFQLFLTVIQDVSNKEIKEHLLDLLTILFPSYKAIFTPQSIILNNLENKTPVLIDDKNFDILQDYVKTVTCFYNTVGGDYGNYNPANKKAQEIAEKLMRGRQIAAAQKGENHGSVLGRYVSILTVGLQSMSLQDCLNLTIYQLYDLIERYSLYVNWDIDIRSRLAGGKPDEKPDDWMKNIH